MRIGKNPTKFARHNSDLVRMSFKRPAPILAATVVFIPRLADYYADALKVLKASLRSLYKTMPEGYDLLVYDNGSCPEVIDFLEAEFAAGRVQWLWRSSGNMKKIGAWNQIFGAAQSDYVYYFDCDILHREGWFEDCMRVFETFPEAGMVNAAPVPAMAPEKRELVLSTTLRMLEESDDVRLEKGYFTEDAWFREFGESLGSDPDTFLAKARRFEQVKATRNGVEVFAQAWHAQFLAKTEILAQFFPQSADWAQESRDHDFDRFLNDCPCLRLGVASPRVAHLGNSITENYRRELEGLLDDESAEARLVRREGGWRSQMMRLPFVRKLVLRLHALTFSLIYNAK